MNNVLKNFNKKKNGDNGFFYICVTLLMAFILFWFLFPIYSYDSAWYLTYLEYFSGNKPLSEWNAVRGFTFPVILWIAHIIKAGSWGIEFVLCFFYMLWGYYLFKTLRFVKSTCFQKKINICDSILVFILALMNSVLWGYFHLVLTECISVSLQMVYAYYAIKFYINRKNQCALKNEYWIFLLLSCIMTILFWFLKQSFVTNTLLLIIIFEILTWFDKPALKKIMYSIGLIICIAVSLKCTTISWNKIIGTDTNYTNSFANRFNMMRYIVVSDRYNGGNVSVMNDDWEVIDSFEYTYENSFSGVLKFWFTCLIKYPDRVLMGYIDNYLLMSDLYQNINTDRMEEIRYEYGPVARDRIWETISGQSKNLDISGEHVMLVRNRIINVYDASKEMEGNSILLEENGYSTTFLEDYNNINFPNFITSFLSGKICWTFSMMVYALLMVTTPFLLVVCFVLYLKKRKAIVGIFLALSFYAFLFTIMHVVEGLPIDRYAIPAYSSMLFAFILMLSLSGEKIREMVFKKENSYEGDLAANIDYHTSL